MYNKENENNFCEVIGLVANEKEFSHEIYGEKFYSFIIKVERLSKSFDYINVTVSEKLIVDDINITPGEKLHIIGQYRSYNNFSGTGNKLILTLFVKDINKVESSDAEFINLINLCGFICKMPVYRVTPFGREITDILLAVNRIHNKSDYIPCIAWGRNAKFASNLNIGDNIKINGRIQSRDYQKKVNDEVLLKTAYEVSINKIEKIN